MLEELADLGARRWTERNCFDLNVMFEKRLPRLRVVR